MLRNINRIFLIIHGLIVIALTILLIYSPKLASFRSLLIALIEDNGFIEIVIFFILLMISSYATITIFNNQTEKIFTKARRNLVALIAIIVYLGAMQEVRWGDLINLNEPNGAERTLRALVNNTGINSLDAIYQIIYLLTFIVFVVLPLLTYLRPHSFDRKPSFKGKSIIYLPSLHNVLMFGFASFIYAVSNPFSNIDKFIVIVAIGLMGIVFINSPELKTKSNIIHYIVVFICTLTMALTQFNIGISNANSRLWKFALAYSFFYWLLNWTLTLRHKVSWKHPW